MLAVQVHHYLTRARDFLEGMKFLQEDLTEFGHSAALLAIHSAIAYSDALRLGLGSTQLSSEDHNRAATELRGLLTQHKYGDMDGSNRLAKLLDEKNKVAYGSKGVAVERFKSIVLQAQRFTLWAEKAGNVLRIEGWHDGGI